VSAHTLSELLTDGPGDINTNVGGPLRHDLARVVTDETVYADKADIVKAAAACAVVKATSGKRV
jgi:hypothetical protein